MWRRDCAGADTPRAGQLCILAFCMRGNDVGERRVETSDRMPLQYLNRLVLLMLLSVALDVTGCRESPQQQKESPKVESVSVATNVIVIVIDALRADHLGVMGHSRDVTPQLDRLAAEGILFTHARSAASWTLPSIASLMTSVYPSVHDLLRLPQERGHNRLAQEFLTLPESLATKGLRTGAVVANPWFWEGTGLSQGFQEVHTIDDAADPREAGAIVSRVIKWLWRNRTAPFFLYVHTMGPHSPYHAPPSYQGRYTGELRRSELIADFDRLYRTKEQWQAYRQIQGRAERDGLTAAELAYLEAQYDEKLAYVDSQLGLLFDAVDRFDLLENTLIIVTADHGEAFFEHGMIFHGEQLHDELLRVPLIMRMPGNSTVSSRCDAVVELVDLYPTIHEALGFEVVPHLQGRSLLRIIRGEPGDGVAFAQGYEFKITTHEWSAFFEYSETPSIASSFKLRELYDLRKDPDERVSLVGRHPEAELRLRQLSLQLWLEMDASAQYWDPNVEPAPIDPETAKRLRNLGYGQ